MAFLRMLAPCLLLPVALAGEDVHTYAVGEKVHLWMNKVGPYHNPQETYEYFKLPYCKPELGIQLTKKALSIGEQLEGHDLTNSGYDIHFAQDVAPTKLCSQRLDKLSSMVFSSAVDVHYWYVRGENGTSTLISDHHKLDSPANVSRLTSGIRCISTIYQYGGWWAKNIRAMAKRTKTPTSSFSHTAGSASLSTVPASLR